MDKRTGGAWLMILVVVATAGLMLGAITLGGGR
jgi:hypothetical protein